MKYLPAALVGALMGLIVSSLMIKMNRLEDKIEYECAYDREKAEYCLRNHYTLETKGTTKIYTEKCQ